MALIPVPIRVPTVPPAVNPVNVVPAAICPLVLTVPNNPAPGKKNDAPINAAPNRIVLNVSPPAPLITGII